MVLYSLNDEYNVVDNLVSHDIITEKFIDDDLIVAGTPSKICWLSKTSSDVLKALGNVNIKLVTIDRVEFLTQGVEWFTNYAQNVNAFVNTGIQWSGKKLHIMVKNNANTLFAFLSRQVGHHHDLKRKELLNYRRYVNKHFLKKICDKEFTKKIAFDDILKKHGDQKRKLYQLGFKKATTNMSIPMIMECMQKTNELKYDSDVKPRNLFNPSEELKALGSYIGQWFLDYCRQHVEGFMVGYNTSDLQYYLEDSWASLKDPVIMTWDGSQHDAHQYGDLIKCVDTPFIQNLYDRAWTDCVDLPFNDVLKDRLFKAITDIKLKFKINDCKSKKRTTVLSGLMNGTVFSGHPTRTTLGNTLRVLSYAQYIAFIAGIPETDLKIHAAGDDMLIFIERKQVQKYRKYYERVYIHENILKDEIAHGLGQVGKIFNISETKIDFLSKYGFVDRASGRVILNRQVNRVLIGGNDTNRIGKHISEQEYNWAITTSIESYGYKYPILNRYIAYRKRNLTHWTPNKSRFANLSDNNEMFYLTYHKSEYDYENVEFELKVRMGEHIVSLIEQSLDQDCHLALSYMDLAEESF